MNIRKPKDYSAVFSALDQLMASRLSQMELYCEIGRLVAGRTEKGAAVAASEYLQTAYPMIDGFSPRNLRRMRAFYASYAGSPEIMRLAMKLGWTQNVTILEACTCNEERMWYLETTARFGWTKAVLMEKIKSGEWLQISLDETEISCYTEKRDVAQESKCDEEDTLCLPRQHLPQPDGGVRDEGLGEEGRAGAAVPYRVGSNQQGGDWQPNLSSGTAQAGRARNLLWWSRGTTAHQQRLRGVRFADRYGQSQSAGYAPHLRRRLCRKAAPPDGLHRPSPRCCRSVVHRRLRSDLAGCAGGMPRTAA